MKGVTVFAAVALLSSVAPVGATGELECRARLSGANEVPPLVTNTTGRANVEFNEALTEATFKLRVFVGEQLTQAHIHCGVAGVNGPIVAFLAGLFGNSTSQNVDGTWVNNATLTSDIVVVREQGTEPNQCPHRAVSTIADIAELARNGQAYVNAHTKANPGGEVRGQLVCSGEDND
jgi:hypothetical protein